MPLFGLPKNQIVDNCPPGRVNSADYAWSAHNANFASVATYARFALRADRLAPGTTSQSSPESLEGYFATMAENFKEVEFQAQSKPGQDAESARYAGCADSAEYALEAEVAEIAVYVAEGEAEGDSSTTEEGDLVGNQDNL